MVKDDKLIEHVINCIRKQYTDIASEESIRFILEQKMDKFLKIVTRNAVLIDKAISDQELDSLSNSSDDAWREMHAMKSN